MAQEKCGAFALGFVFVWYIVEGIINLGARGLDYYFKWDLLEWVTHILPLNAMSNLIKQPFTRISIIDSGLNQIGSGEIKFNYEVEWIDVLSVILWSMLFIYWSYWLVKRRDL